MSIKSIIECFAPRNFQIFEVLDFSPSRNSRIEKFFEPENIIARQARNQLGLIKLNNIFDILNNIIIYF